VTLITILEVASSYRVAACGRLLARSARQLGLPASEDDLRSVLRTFAELDPRPDLADALAVLGDRGWQLLALTMGASSGRNLSPPTP
jgi:hypothetical protein